MSISMILGVDSIQVCIMVVISYNQMHFVFCVCMCVCPLQFLERMQLEYHTKALDRGVYVIGSCGFDSIPADLGILYTQRQFKGKKQKTGSVSHCVSKACKWFTQ